MSKVLETPPAATTPAAEPPSFADRSKNWSGEDWAKYDRTGEEPAAPPASNKEGNTAAPPATEGKTPEVPPQGDAPKTDSATGAGQQVTQEPPEDERRLSRRDRRIRAQNLQIAELQRELAAARQQRGQNPQQAPATHKPAVAPTRPKMPRLDQFDTLDAYNQALDQYETDIEAYHDAKLSAKQQEIERQRATEHATREAEEEFVDVQSSFHKRCAEYRKNPEAAETFDQAFQAVSTATQKAGAGWIDQYVLHTPHGPAIIDHLGKHPEVLADLLQLDPMDGMEVLVGIKQSIQKAPVPKRISHAPEPPDKLGGTGSDNGPVPGSAAWMAAEDAKDVARLKQAGRL